MSIAEIQDHHETLPAGRKVRLLLAALLIPLLVLTAVAAALLWPDNRKQDPIALGPPTDFVDARVADLELRPCNNDPAAGQCVIVMNDITSGPDRGEQTTLSLPIGPGQPDLAIGDKVVLGRAVDPLTDQVTYYFSDFERRSGMVALSLVFAALVVLVARWRGLGALIGLVLTWGIVTQFMIPSILEGKSPTFVALTGGSVIVLVVLYVAHGLNARTTTAVIGTLVTMLIVGGLSVLAVELTHVTGLASEEAAYVQNFAGRVNIQGLLLGGMILGALGVLNDMTVSQASSVWEIHRARPGRTRRALYKAGMRVGRDHIASTVYTLVLAYTGAALPLLILFTLTNRQFGEVATTDVVGEELVRALVGGIGIVLSVPITTALAAFVVKGQPVPAVDPDHAEPDERPRAAAAAPEATMPFEDREVPLEVDPVAEVTEDVEPPERTPAPATSTQPVPDTPAVPGEPDEQDERPATGPDLGTGDWDAPAPRLDEPIPPAPTGRRWFGLRRRRSDFFRTRHMSRKERKFWEED